MSAITSTFFGSPLLILVGLVAAGFLLCVFGVLGDRRVPGGVAG